LSYAIFFQSTGPSVHYSLSLHDALPICTTVAVAANTAVTGGGAATISAASPLVVAGNVIVGGAIILTAGESAENDRAPHNDVSRSEEHTSELQSLRHLVCRLLLEKKKQQ